MPAPFRANNGITLDAPWQPLGNVGVVNPFFYNRFEEDFDFFSNQKFNTTQTSTGTVAQISFDGGAVQYTTAATLNDSVGITSKFALMAMVPATSTYAGKKAAFLTRLRLADATNDGFVVGLQNLNSNPLTATDGIYFQKATGSAVINLIVKAASTTILTLPVPYTMTSAVDVDLAWYHDGRGNIRAGASPNFVGFASNSGSGTTTPTLFPTAAAYMNPNDGPNNVASLPTVIMAPVASLQAGTAAVKTMIMDFIFAGRER